MDGATLEAAVSECLSLIRKPDDEPFVRKACGLLTEAEFRKTVEYMKWKSQRPELRITLAKLFWCCLQNALKNRQSAPPLPPPLPKPLQYREEPRGGEPARCDWKGLASQMRRRQA